MACTPDGKWVYVPCIDGDYWVVDGEKQAVVKKIHTGGRPHNTQCSRDGRWMYLSPMGDPHRVTIVDVKGGHEVAGYIPFSDSVRPPALAPDNKRLFQDVDNLIGFEVADIQARKVVARIEHKLPDELRAKPSRCHGIAIRPDQKEIWCCDVEHQLVHVHDITRPDYPQIAVIDMPNRVYWLCFTPDSKRAYVAAVGGRKTCVVDAQAKKVITSIDVGEKPKRNLVVTLKDEKPAGAGQ
jgi:DNA-binding beta-propeller fold protein YncE